MTTVESFQAVAALGAAAGVAALCVPGLRGRPATARHAGALTVTVCAWLMLLGSLVSRADLTSLRNRLDTPTRAAAAAVAVAVVVAVSLLLVRLVIRRPGIWFVMLALAIPIRVPLSLGGDRSGNLLIPLYWVIGIGLIAYVWGAARGRLPGARERSTPLDIPIAAFTAFALASTLWSGDVHEATVKAVFFYVPFVLVFRLVVHWWPLVENPVPALGHTTLAVAVVAAAIAVGQFATRTIWWNDTLEQGNVYNRFFRANGIFYDPNILGRYLVVALTIAAVYAWVARRGAHLAILAAVGAVLAAGLVVTFSRSSALALMVAMAMIAWRAFGWRRTLLVGAGALVLIGVPAVATNTHVRDKVTSIDKLAGSGEGRFRLVRGGVDLWKSEPVLGVGLGAFSERYRESLPRRQQLRTRVVISHTAPVTVLAELGAVGFALFLFLCGTAVVTLWRSARAARPDGWVEWTALTGLAAILVHSLLYSALFEDPTIWVLAAAGVAAAATGMAGEPEATQTFPTPAPEPAPAG